ncbi:MAG: hypothetical protein JWL58_1537 [Streptosporangiaceae bacterium]|nr:hypothetical protein [Streptosporangiaceae bacterium]
MSGYGGQPSGWRDPYDPYDPYGQPQPGWQDPYDPQAGWQQPPGYGAGYGYGPPGVPPSGTTNGSAIGALICNIVALFGVFFCCLGAVASLPGAILGGMALGRTQSNPESARQLALWSWICFGLSIVLSVGMILLFLVMGRFGPTYY